MKTEPIYNVEGSYFLLLALAKLTKLLVLLDISAEWCAPCRVSGTSLHKLAGAYDGAFLLALVDADEKPRIAGRHKVRGFPTVIAYSRGLKLTYFHSAKAKGFCVILSIAIQTPC